MPNSNAPTKPSLMSTRALSRTPSSVSVESRSFEAVLTSEFPVRTWIHGPSGQYIEVDEVLVTSGVDLSRARGMPLLDSHSAWGIEHVLGQVDDIRNEVVEGRGSCLVIAARVKPSRAEIIAEMAEGFHANLSAGYAVLEYELIYREGDVPLARAVRWTLLEASLVALGADPNASVRSAQLQPPTVRVAADPTQDPVMTFAETLAAAEAAVAAAETALAALPDAPAGTDAAVATRAAAVRAKLTRSADEPAAPAVTDVAPPASDPAAAAPAATETDAEKAAREIEALAVEAVLASARGYGAEVVKLATDLKALGARSEELRTAVRTAISAKAASVTTTVLAPAAGQRSGAPQGRSATDIYARMNKPRA